MWQLLVKAFPPTQKAVVGNDACGAQSQKTFFTNQPTFPLDLELNYYVIICVSYLVRNTVAINVPCWQVQKTCKRNTETVMKIPGCWWFIHCLKHSGLGLKPQGLICRFGIKSNTSNWFAVCTTTTFWVFNLCNPFSLQSLSF